MNDDELSHYSAALDEIWRLRTALAYEADVLAAHLDYATFPKRRRPIAETQLRRMRDAIAGHSGPAYSGIPTRDLDAARQKARLHSLTRWQWEHRPTEK